MIEFKLENETVYLNCRGESFDDYLEEVKRYKIKFDWDKKSHIVPKRKFNLIFNELQYFDTIRCYPSYPAIQKFCEIKPEIEYYRLPVKNELLVYPPVQGKEPYENYQYEDIRKTVTTNRLYNSCEMGMGKTYEMISSINHIEELKGVEKYLIICPANILYNWKVEIKKFYYKEIKNEDFYIVNVKNRNPFESDAKFIIMTYRSLLMLSDEAHRKKYPRMYTKEAKKKRKEKSKKGKETIDYRHIEIGVKEWLKDKIGCIILDEAHNIKNHDSKSYKVIKMQIDYFKFRYLMSGTPFPKNVIDCYTQMELLDPTIINMEYTDFISYVAVLGTKYSKYGIRYIRPDKEAEILKKIEPYMIRRYSDDVLDLPEHIMKKNYCEFSDFQLEIYREVIKDTLIGIQEDKGSIKFKDIKQKFPYLIQAIHNPCLLKDKFFETGKHLETLLNKWKFKDNSKLEIMDDLIDVYVRDERRKVIIWGYHPDSLYNLSEYYKIYHPILIKREMKNEERIEAVEEFKKSKKNHILITSSLMTSEGMTITESTRNIIFERNYEFNKFYQLIKRNHRIGQTDSVITNILLILDSLEIAQNKMLEEREDLNNNMFDEEYLNKKQMEKLFEGDLNIFEM